MEKDSLRALAKYGHSPVAKFLSGRPAEFYKLFVGLFAASPRNVDPLPQQERMPHDLGLLFQAVTLKRPAGSQGVVVSAERMAHCHQVPATTRLGLPDMSHLVDEMALELQVRLREIVAIVG